MVNISACDPTTKTVFFRSFCLSLYGSALWRLSFPALRSLEVTFNNILRKLWSLSRRCHTAILHMVAGLSSLFNAVERRSLKLTQTAINSGSSLLNDVYSQSINLVLQVIGLPLRCTQDKDIIVQISNMNS